MSHFLFTLASELYILLAPAYVAATPPTPAKYFLKFIFIILLGETLILKSYKFVAAKLNSK